jgi:hypothetical protein
MPGSLAAVLVLVFALFPGFIGNRIYETFIGIDWREREWRTVLRLTGFSVTGAVIYSAIAPYMGLNQYPPLHLFPSTFRHLTADSPLVNKIAIAFIGHIACSVIAGVLAVVSANGMGWISSKSMYPGAWDDFVRRYTADHWVIVGLKNGMVYAGKLKNADVAVATEDRDLVLEEPCEYNSDSGQYVAVGYQHLFVPASTWYSIAVIYDHSRDKRTVQVSEALFYNEEENEHG